MPTVDLPKRVLVSVKKPARYVGGERGQVIKQVPATRQALLRFALAFPDTYEIGMSNSAVQILYGLINREEDMWCERVFAPWPDMEAKMREEDISLFTLESRTKIKAMDVLGFTLQYELAYTNVLNMLDLAKIPFYAKDRTKDDPILIAGGPVTYNPEPVADFFDVIFIGEAEDVLIPLLNEIKAYKNCPSMSKEELLQSLSHMEGVYVPSLYRLDTDPPIKKAYVKDLDQVYVPTKPIIPNTAIVHDRMSIELFRGCPRACRFCQAGFAYRPVRDKKPETLIKLAQTLKVESGYDECGLLSLSTSDYRYLPELATELLEDFSCERINISLPSLRADQFSLDLMDMVTSTRKSGLTFAPEAGSQRLRDVINKQVTEDELIETCTTAFKGGYTRLKLYFMLGLPTETDEDVLAIAKLCKRILYRYKISKSKSNHNSLNLTISTALFIPKPNTPFQWAAQLDRKTLIERQALLRKALPKQVKYDSHHADSSYWEAVLSRGDKKLSRLLVEVWKTGARFDAWDEHFSAKIWENAAKDLKVDTDDYALRQRDVDEPLPWSHIDTGVSKTLLRREWSLAKEGLAQVSFRSKQNLIHMTDKRNLKDAKLKQEEIEVFTMRLFFERKDTAEYISHLDLVRTVERSLRRARFKLFFTEGYNPRPHMVFALPSGVGIRSNADIVDIRLLEAVDEEQFLSRINQAFPPGFIARKAVLQTDRTKPLMTLVEACLYQFCFKGAADYARALLLKERLIVNKFSKGRSVPMDIRPLITSCDIQDEDSFTMQVMAGNQVNLRPEMVMEAIVTYLGLDADRALDAEILRLELYTLDKKNQLVKIS